MHDFAPSQEPGEREASEAQLYEDLKTTLSLTAGFTNEKMRRGGFGHLVEHGRRLTTEGGGDGLYEHMALLNIEPNQSDSGSKDSFGINTFTAEGIMQVTESHRKEGERPHGFLANLNPDGTVQEAYYTGDNMHRRDPLSEGLDPEKAKKFVQGVITAFNDEIDRRKRLLRGEE